METTLTASKAARNRRTAPRVSHDDRGDRDGVRHHRHQRRRPRAAVPPPEPQRVPHHLREPRARRPCEEELYEKYLPKLPGQCRARLTTIGSAKTALMTATGIQVRGRRKARRLARGPCCQITAASAAARITGTKNRKQACPWIRNQPVRVKIHRSRAAPAATDAAATRKAMYAGTYIQGIQSRLRIRGSVATKPRSTARADGGAAQRSRPAIHHAGDHRHERAVQHEYREDVRVPRGRHQMQQHRRRATARPPARTCRRARDG